MNHTWYRSQANLRIRAEQIEDKLMDENLLTRERAALLEEKNRLYRLLYPAEVKKDDDYDQ